ncbi:DNA topoisomerase IB [Sphingobacterium multivorum]|uniref:Eukaryotic DNA topoisomerase I, catalytic core n=1 Tax=Sphingobacterium multivorum TaxID=28454 RepID=A0A2X2L610_SPHMU|nr:DNA topoisomerase IB [Sphingobacterium multivorum]QRQ63380.1 DNA topoisomerase IB [Sphingobacterium multivorum]SPZ84640.1 Eukaryotic DNA topoisomerase I, catalytic core [Sphingobacterium multivorum]
MKARTGYTRRKVGKSFKYFDASEKEVSDKKILERIAKLVIPPNWTDVWIAKSSKSDLQAFGFDQKGRKQYIYHSKFVGQRQAAKFSNILYMGKYLQELRNISSKHLKHEFWDMDKLCAVAFKIMDSTLIRIGNKRYTLTNKSYGLSTLEKRHVSIEGNRISLAYKGKKGVFQQKSWTNKQQAKLLEELLKMKGKRIFQMDSASCESTFCGSAFNQYLRKNCTGEISCKSIRIWGASREAFYQLAQTKQAGSLSARKRQLNSVIKKVAEQLGNTKSVSQTYYIHPAIQQVFMEAKFPFIKDKLPLAKLEERVFRFLRKHG